MSPQRGINFLDRVLNVVSYLLPVVFLQLVASIAQQAACFLQLRIGFPLAFPFRKTALQFHPKALSSGLNRMQCFRTMPMVVGIRRFQEPIGMDQFIPGWFSESAQSKRKDRRHRYDLQIQ